MAIQVRRGNESDFDASKMLPGEWAVSLDTRYVRMCFAPGIVLRMSTYDAFEADMAQIQAILAECRSIQSAVQRIQSEVNAKAALTVEYSNGAKESADRAYSEAERAKIYADNAEAVTGVQIATKERAGLIKGGDNYIAEDGTLTLITETTSTTQPNSYAGRENILEIGGVTEQDSTSGKNLLDCSGLTEETRRGITFTPIYSTTEEHVKNGYPLGSLMYINMNGTSTEIIYYDFVTDDILQGTYILNGLTQTDYDLGCAFGILELTATNAIEREYTVETDGTYTFRIKIPSEVTLTNSKFYPMIRLATETDATYEPFTNGPAPNPSYPMEIKKTVVSGVKTHGRQLLDLRNGNSGTKEGVTFTNNGDGSYALNGTATGDSGNMWFLGGYNRTPASDDSNVILTLYKGRSYYISDCNLFTVKDGNTASYKGLVIPTYDIKITGVRNPALTNGKTYNENIYPMVIEGDSLLPWEPYTEKEITLSQPIELYGKDAVQDVITAQPIKRRFAKVVLDGSDDESFTKEAGSDYVFRHRHGFSNVISYRQNQLCTHLLRANSYNELTAKEGYFAISSTSIIVNISGITTSTDLRSFLAENPMTFVFELAEETTEVLPIVDQIGLNSLQTYDGITYVEFIYDELEPTFKGKYGTSEVGGMTLESLLIARNNELKQELASERLSALEASVVNNI